LNCSALHSAHNLSTRYEAKWIFQAPQFVAIKLLLQCR
jgi:hypothetical protein